MVELGEARSGTLRGELSRALGDPTLEVGYRVRDTGAVVDSEGRALSLPDPGSERSVTMVERDGRPVAALVHDPGCAGRPGATGGGGVRGPARCVIPPSLRRSNT